MNFLLIRGLAREKGHWADFTETLAKELSTNVLTIDLPGAGELCELKSPLKISDYTDHMRNQFLKLTRLANLEDQSNWVVLGISMGGMIALDWTSRYENDFKSAILINSSVGDLSLPYERMQPKALIKIFKIVKIKDLISREKSVLKLSCNLLTESKRKTCAKIFSKFYINHKFKKINLFKQLVAASKFKKPKSIKTELLILCSKNDKITNYNCSIKIAKYYQSKIIIHQTAGHDIPLDDPHWIIKQLKIQLSKIK